MTKKRGRKARDEARRREAERAAAAGLPALAPVKGRSASGRAERLVGQGYERDASKVALAARARHLGIDPADHASLRDHRLEDEAGMAICLGASDEVEREALWACWSSFSAARMAFHRRTLGIGTFGALPKALHGARRTEARDDDRPDERTPEEKDADAAKAWDYWRGRLALIPAASRDVMRDAVTGGIPFVGIAENTRDTAGTGPKSALSADGRRFIAALRLLAAARRNPV